MAVRRLNFPMAGPVLPGRIGGWLWLLVAYLLVGFISAVLMIVIYLLAMVNHWTVFSQAMAQPIFVLQWLASLVTAACMGALTLWTLRLLLKRSRRFPKAFVIWLLAGVLLALKSFAFSPITDDLALHTLYWPLLAAALGVPYIKRSARVKQTFIEP